MFYGHIDVLFHFHLQLEVCSSVNVICSEKSATQPAKMLTASCLKKFLGTAVLLKSGQFFWIIFSCSSSILVQKYGQILTVCHYYAMQNNTAMKNFSKIFHVLPSQGLCQNTNFFGENTKSTLNILLYCFLPF